PQLRLDRKRLPRPRPGPERPPPQPPPQPLPRRLRRPARQQMNHPNYKTQHLNTTPEDIARAAEILRDGGTVAFPTETVYGLGANALDANAVASIFAAKERPNWDPVIVHVSDRAMLDQVAIVPEQAERLIAAFWPGPL